LFYVCSTLYTVPTVPKAWPTSWYTWVVTTITKDGANIYVRGQFVVFDFHQGLVCRFDQQDLITKSNARPVDFCDYTEEKYHYSLNDTSPTGACGGMKELSDHLEPIVYPPEFVEKAFLHSVDFINGRYCNHFLALDLHISGQNVQMDIWTGVDDEIPCQMSVHDIQNKAITTWAFDAFKTVIPDQMIQCTAPRLLCRQPNWVCRAVPNSEPDQLGQQLRIVCDPLVMDCSPINPGGDFYLPNTVEHHCNWAFNNYYQTYKAKLGVEACSFGSVSELVPPSLLETEEGLVYLKNSAKLEHNELSNIFTVFALDLACVPLE